MKKWYRMGICLVLAICLLMLSACQPGNSPKSTGATGSQQNQNNENTNQVTETVALNWSEKYISLSGWPLWEEDAPKIAKVLDYESYKALMDECVSRHGACTFDCYLYSEDDGLCPYGRTIRNLPYTKEFFDTNSLIVLGLSDGSGSTIFEMRDLTYTGGVLTCTIDILWTRGLFQTCDMASWFCFVEVDTVLSTETEIILDLQSAEYDRDTYMQKSKQFDEICSP